MRGVFQVHRVECRETRPGFRGRFHDNIFTERPWRTVEYEEVHLHDYENVWSAEKHVGRHLSFYDDDRPHQSLDWQTRQRLIGVVYKRGRSPLNSRLSCPAIGE